VLILDTDHFSELIRGTKAGGILRDRLREVIEPFSITIITVDEGFRGWMAEIARARSSEARISNYGSLQTFTRTLSHWSILPWTADSERVLAFISATKPRIGTMDLRIAAIMLANDATLLSRNLRDFRRLPGLKVENWLN
jgi:tRNA(fMet)-specific endonuclease VapC